MSNKYLHMVAETNRKYHKSRADLPYEEKFKIIIELQKINAEMMKTNKSRKTIYKEMRIWKPE